MTINAAVDAAMREEVVYAVPLLLLDFVDGREFLALGTHDIVLSQNTYKGTGDAVSLSPIRSVFGAAAAKQEIHVPATNPKMMARGLRAKELVSGRYMALYRARFDESLTKLLASPKVIFSGTMEDVRFEGDGVTQKLIITCETVMAKKRISRNAYLTDSDIQSRHAGDLFGQFIASHADKRVEGPVIVP